MPDFVSPEYENSLFVIAKKNSDYFVFVEKNSFKDKAATRKAKPCNYCCRIRKSLKLRFNLNFNYHLAI